MERLNYNNVIMKEYVKHHYVPKFYLKNFTNNNVFSFFNVETMEYKEKINYESQCFIKNFYGNDAELEKVIALKETKWSVVVNKLINLEPINSSDKELLKEFAVYQYVRTNAFRKAMNIREKIILDQYLINNGVSNDDEKAFFYYLFNKFKVDNERDPYNEKVNISIIDKFDLLKELSNKDILIKRYDTKSQLITSDVPVIMYNPANNSDIGLNGKKSIIILPLSRNMCMYILNKNIYSRNKDKEYIYSQSENDVCRINLFECCVAEKFIYGTNRDLTEIFKNNVKKRNEYKSQTICDKSNRETKVFLNYLNDDYCFGL